MKRILLSLVVLAAVAAVGFGSAASVGPINGGTLQAGIVQVPGDADGVALEYSTHFAGDAESHVYGMKVTDVDAPVGSWVLVGLFSDEEWPITSGASQIAMLRGDVEAGGIATIDERYQGGWVAWNMGNSVKASDIRAVSIVIKSTNE